MQARDLTFQNGPVTLAGTLTRPDRPGPHPLVVMIHGSGPLDRDGNMPGQRLDIFNALAVSLAEGGYAAFRYDKRGCGASTGDYLTHGFADLIADAGAVVAGLRAMPGFGPVYLLGHSEGTILAPQVAAQEGGIAGLILICPFITDGRAMLMAQAGHMARMFAEMRGPKGWVIRSVVWARGGVLRQQARTIDRLLGSTDAAMMAGRKDADVRSLRDFLLSDNRAVHSANRLPTLLIAAEKDIQCDPADAGAIAALNPGAAVVTLPDMTHVLRRKTGAHYFADYPQLIAGPVDPQVGSEIVSWLRGQAETTNRNG
jgi:uncharacterized protein